MMPIIITSTHGHSFPNELSLRPGRPHKKTQHWVPGAAIAVGRAKKCRFLSPPCADMLMYSGLEVHARHRWVLVRADRDNLLHAPSAFDLRKGEGNGGRLCVKMAFNTRKPSLLKNMSGCHRQIRPPFCFEKPHVEKHILVFFSVPATAPSCRRTRER